VHIMLNAHGWVLTLRAVVVLCEGTITLLAAVFLSVTFHICTKIPSLLICVPISCLMNVKIKIYETILSYFVLYVYETWGL
jgi:hypothetical protein